MQKTAAIWIDHRRAVVVLITEKGEQVRQITSSIEKQLRQCGRKEARATYESSSPETGGSRERDFRSGPANFYDEIIACLDGITTVLVFGAGDAKDELQKRIRGKSFFGPMVSLEEAGKKTDAEIIDMLRKRILEDGSESGSKGSGDN
jgi:hypothetical protein